MSLNMVHLYMSMATDEPYSFLYVRLNAKDKNNMFYIRFEKRLELN